MVFNSSPKILETIFRWKKQTPKELNIQVFLKNLSKLKTRFRHFQFFPLVLNHITHEHTHVLRVCTYKRTGTHAHSHIKHEQKKSSVSLRYM